MLAVRILILLAVTTLALAAPYFVQCYDFGCKATREIHYSDLHWAVTIIEIDTNERFVVDSRYRKREFPVAFHPELAAN